MDMEQCGGELIRVTQLPVIEERLRGLKEDVQRRVDEAAALVATEETVGAVKKLRADMNKEFSAFEAQRKAVKAAIMAPYDRFEEVYRDCVAEPFRRADSALKEQIDKAEGEIRGRCEATLQSYFRELCAVHHIDFLNYEQLGVKVDMASAKAKTPKKRMEQIKQAVEGVAGTMAAIDRMNHGEEIAVEYKKCLNLPLSIKAVTERHNSLKEEQRRREEAQEREQEAAPAATEPAEITPVPHRVEQAEVKKITCTFMVTDTRERLVLLRNFLKANGYEYK